MIAEEHRLRCALPGCAPYREGFVPLSTLFFFVCAVGIAAAMVGGSELRLSPRHLVSTNSFVAYLVFVLLLVLPVAIYFYWFHGDWFLHYWVDVRTIPSILVLLGFALLIALLLASFAIGAAFARSQRPAWGGIAVGLCLLLSCGVLFWPDRLGMVGSFPEFTGGFGLQPYGGALLRGGVAMSLYLMIGTAFLLIRIRMGARR